MNKRQISFMNMLLCHDQEFLPIDFYAGELDTSSKTLRRDLEQVQRFLDEFGAVIDKKSGVGIRLRIGGEQKGKLNNHLSYLAYAGQSAGGQTWEKDSRRMDIALNLLLYSDEYTSLASLAYKYYVSKSTIHSDFMHLEKLFGRFSLHIRKTMDGTIIAGEERDIRQAVVYILSRILNPNAALVRNGEMADDASLPHPDTLSTVLDIFREDDICFVNQLLGRMEETHDYRFDDSEFVNVSLNLLVMVYRLKNSCVMEPEAGTSGFQGGLAGPLENEVEEVCNRIWGHYHMELPLPERVWLKNIFLLTHMFETTGENGNGDEVFRLFCEDFIDAFTTITNINLRENPSFCENVISHINLMLKRLLGRTPASNPLMELLIKDYQSTLNVCRIICCILARKFGLPELSVDEISFLMLYILGETVRQSEHARVLFVTDMTKSIANLTKLRLQQRFPQWNFDTCASDGYRTAKRESYDFCISTAMLDTDEHSIPYVFVSPILENRDFKNIQELFWKTSESTSVYHLELIRIINDLHDIGCDIRASDSPVDRAGSELIRISALKGIQYIYSVNGLKKNHCIFVLDSPGTRIREVHIDMCNLDFMLFSSKIVYLLDNCPDDVIPGFINYLTGGEANV